MYAILYSIERPERMDTPRFFYHCLRQLGLPCGLLMRGYSRARQGRSAFLETTLVRFVAVVIYIFIGLVICAGGLLLVEVPDMPAPGLILLGAGVFAWYRYARANSARRVPARLTPEGDAFEAMESDRANIDYDFERRARGDFDDT